MEVGKNRAERRVLEVGAVPFALDRASPGRADRGRRYPPGYRYPQIGTYPQKYPHAFVDGVDRRTVREGVEQRSARVMGWYGQFLSH